MESPQTTQDMSVDCSDIKLNQNDVSLNDEGIDCPNEISSDYSDPDSCPQTTPEVVLVESSACDSGFTDSLANSIDLQCLECVLEWPSSRKHDTRTYGTESGSVIKCTCASQEHDGFEEYVQDIFLHRLHLETKYHVTVCLDNQPEISAEKRRHLVNWLTESHHNLKLCQDTLYLTVHIFDRVLDVMQVSRDCLELLGVTCLLVASKQNEICPPEIHELLATCHEQFTRDQVKQLEMIVLMATSFDLIAPTVQQFLEYYAAFSLSTCAGDGEQTFRLKMARAESRCVLELSLQEYELCQFRPSVLAFCVWNAAVQHLKTYTDCSSIRLSINVDTQQLDVCMASVHLFLQKFQQTCPDMSLIFKKYANLYGSK